LQYANHIQHMVQQNERLLEAMHIKSDRPYERKDHGKEKGGKKSSAGQG